MNNARHFQKNAGLTLIEVLVAVAILGIIALISTQTLQSTIQSKESVEKKMKELARIDRGWLLMENDFKNILNVARTQNSGAGSGQMLPAFIVQENGDYLLVMTRGGNANPLDFPRSELLRVAYRLEDEVLWRYVWYNLGSVNEDDAQKQKIVEGVEEMKISLLSNEAKSFTDGPWLDEWNANMQQTASGTAQTVNQNGSNTAFPSAIKVSLTLKGYEEVTRVFALVSST